MTAKRIALVLAVITIVALVTLSPARLWALELVEWVHARGPKAAVLYAIAYVAAAVLMIPASGLTIGAGFAFGVVWGAVLVIPASIAAALIAFAIARRFARDWVARRIAGNPTFAALDRAIGRSGFKITLLVRLSPLFPYGLLNYALGITGVRLRDYALASAIGMLPGTILYVYLGSLVTSASELGQRQVGSWLHWVAGGLAVAVIIAVMWIARRALQRELAEAHP